MKTFIIIVLCVVGVIFGILLTTFLIAQNAKTEYLTDAGEIISKLTEINNGLDIGYSLSDYRTAVRELNGLSKQFQNKYAKVDSAKSGWQRQVKELHWPIISAVDEHIRAVDMWTTKLDYGADVEFYDALIQISWKMSRQLTEQAEEEYKKLKK